MSDWEVSLVMPNGHWVYVTVKASTYDQARNVAERQYGGKPVGCQRVS